MWISVSPGFKKNEGGQEAVVGQFEFFGINRGSCHAERSEASTWFQPGKLMEKLGLV